MVPEIVMEMHEKYGYPIEDVMEYYTEAMDLNPDCGVDEFLKGFFEQKYAKDKENANG